ncbi:hypothetical protein [Spirosoma aerolatum]|uniref:hypothetical protein n=1 Tax=Spirosoma aerolatum TaxID=1211326 RepID=UPI0009AD4A9A|nr:hypothetical protein [Spirosoma aerolatum]
MAKQDINNIQVKSDEDPLDVFYNRNEKANGIVLIAMHRLPKGEVDFDICNIGLTEHEMGLLTLRLLDRVAKDLKL